MTTTSNTPAPVNTNSVNNTKIHDFGQKIGGARKDMAKEAADFVAKLAGLTANDLTALSLSKLVKFDQVQRLAASGAISALLPALPLLSGVPSPHAPRFPVKLANGPQIRPPFWLKFPL